MKSPVGAKVGLSNLLLNIECPFHHMVQYYCGLQEVDDKDLHLPRLHPYVKVKNILLPLTEKWSSNNSEFGRLW